MRGPQDIAKHGGTGNLHQSMNLAMLLSVVVLGVAAGELNMLHTVLGQVAPTPLLPPRSHDLSPLVQSTVPLLTPSAHKYRHVSHHRRRNDRPCGAHTSQQKHFIVKYILDFTFKHVHTLPHPHVSLVSPILARQQQQQQQPGVWVLRALIRGAGPIGKDH